MYCRLLSSDTFYNLIGRRRHNSGASTSLDSLATGRILRIEAQTLFVLKQFVAIALGLGDPSKGGSTFNRR